MPRVQVSGMFVCVCANVCTCVSMYVCSDQAITDYFSFIFILWEGKLIFSTRGGVVADHMECFRNQSSEYYWWGTRGLHRSHPFYCRVKFEGFNQEHRIRLLTQKSGRDILWCKWALGFCTIQILRNVQSKDYSSACPNIWLQRWGCPKFYEDAELVMKRRFSL